MKGDFAVHDSVTSQGIQIYDGTHTFTVDRGVLWIYQAFQLVAVYGGNWKLSVGK